jgi:hypothetical protein
MARRARESLMDRRNLLKFGGLTMAGACLGGMAYPLRVRAAQKKTRARGTARFAIFIEMVGAPSQMETFDFKEMKQTPGDLEVSKVAPDLYMSNVLFPATSKIASKLTFVRSMRTKELNHGLGMWHTQTGRSLNPAVAKEIPGFGTVIASELQSSRRETDTFPGYISMGVAKARAGQIGSGFFHPRFAGVDLVPADAIESFGGSREGGDARLEENYRALQMISAETAKGRGLLGEKETLYQAFYQTAYTTLVDARWSKVFHITEEEKKRYGNTQFGLGALLARNLISADAGTRFVYINDGLDWDHHSNIFEKGKGLYRTCPIWDTAFAALVNDLASMPGHEPGKTLLDETIIATGTEFGRTPAVNPADGRDHYNQTFTSVWVGGGVVPGRIIGKTSEDGGKCVETGWKYKVQPYPDNSVATIYSALGIDWGKYIESTPSGRGYEYIQSAPIGGADLIAADSMDEIFQA